MDFLARMAYREKANFLGDYREVEGELEKANFLVDFLVLME